LRGDGLLAGTPPEHPMGIGSGQLSEYCVGEGSYRGRETRRKVEGICLGPQKEIESIFEPRGASFGRPST